MFVQVIYSRDFHGDNAFPANMGGEAIPYLLHIVRHYDNLPSVVIFSQVRAAMCAQSV